MPLLSDAELADLRSEMTDALPEACTVYRAGLAVLDTVCSVSLGTVQQPAVEGNPRTLEHTWDLRLPYASTPPVEHGDTLQAAQELYTVMEVLNPRTYATSTRAVCWRLGAAPGDGSAVPGTLPWANATVTVTDATMTTRYLDRPVVLLFPLPYEEGGAGSGGRMVIPALLYDLPTALYTGTDSIVVTSLAGRSLVPEQQQNFSVEVAEYLPDRQLWRVTLVGAPGVGVGEEDEVYRPNATVLCLRAGIQQGDARAVQLTFPTAKEKVAAGAVTLPATLRDDVDADWQPGDYLRIVSLVGVTAPLAVKSWSVGGVIRHPAPRQFLEADLTGPL